MVETVTLEDYGVKVVLISTGAAILSIYTPDRNGQLDDIVLGHPNVEDYAWLASCFRARFGCKLPSFLYVFGIPTYPVAFNHSVPKYESTQSYCKVQIDSSGSYFGCIVGRVANRIKQATFTLPAGDVTVDLEANDPPHALHGGSNHWGRREWDVEHDPDSTSACFTLRSPDGDANYPGAVVARVKYKLHPGSQSQKQILPTLRVIMEASTDSCTPINMVQHTHWNLAGSHSVAQGRTICEHELKLLGCSHYTPVDSTLIPTGQVEPVSGTVLDFSTEVQLGPRLSQMDDGIDHNFITEPCGTQWRSANLDVASEPGGMKHENVRTVPICQLRDPDSGRGLMLSSNAPGLQVYTGNFLEGVAGKNGVEYRKHQSICLESQTFPNSVNEESFPSPFIRPGEVYRHRMDVRFFQFAADTIDWGDVALD